MFIQSVDQFFVLKLSHLVCENHFCDNDYKIPITCMNNQRLLKKNAVHSVVGSICIGKLKYRMVILVIIICQYFIIGFQY